MNKLTSIEDAKIQVTEIARRLKSGELKPVTLEFLQEELANGRITETEYQRKVRWYQLTPKAREEFRQECIRRKLEPKFGPIPSWER